MIGGRVLDTSAILDVAEQRTAYGAALVDVAASLGIGLLIPAAALLEAWQWSTSEGRPFLELLPRMPTAVVDQVTADSAAKIGVLAADAGAPDARPGTAHAVQLAGIRGWPVVTAEVGAVLALDPHARFESLP